MRRFLFPALFVALVSSASLRAAETPATPEAKLAALGLALPVTNPPIANYVSAVRTGNLVFLSGHLPYDAEGKVIVGKVGKDTDEKTANAAALQRIFPQYRRCRHSACAAHHFGEPQPSSARLPEAGRYDQSFPPFAKPVAFVIWHF